MAFIPRIFARTIAMSEGNCAGKKLLENIAQDNRKGVFHSSRQGTPGDNQQNTVDGGRDRNNNYSSYRKSWKQGQERPAPQKNRGIKIRFCLD